MRIVRFFFICSVLVMSSCGILAQEVYIIKADSTKLIGCDSNVLIIENHTQTVKDFFFNTGNGHTIFKKGVIKINDSMYLMGADTLRVNAWFQGGNKWGQSGILGTNDNNHLDLYTNSLQQARLKTADNLLASNGITRGLYINPVLQSAMDFRAIEVAKHQLHGNQFYIRYDLRF